MKKILVTGGAGYIGSHAVKALLNVDYDVTVLDNLSKGHKESVDERAGFVQMDLQDQAALTVYLSEQKFDAVMHFAGSIEVGLSMLDPASFFENNLVNGVRLLEAMRESGTKAIIFSSTAAVYGNPVSIPIKEEDPLAPTNFYGQSKLMFEKVLKAYERHYGIRHVALRYFNAAGADSGGGLGEDHDPETHLLPLVFKTALGKNESLKIFGDDYDTPDGTCVRDYIHVTDLVDAHVKALLYLAKGGDSTVFNLGNGNGFSVRQVLEMAGKIVGKAIPHEVAPRRAGDPAVLVADASRAEKLLGWKPVLGLETIVESAWNWHRSKPDGFEV